MVDLLIVDVTSDRIFLFNMTEEQDRVLDEEYDGDVVEWLDYEGYGDKHGFDPHTVSHAWVGNLEIIKEPL